MYGVNTNDVSGYLNLSVRIAHTVVTPYVYTNTHTYLMATYCVISYRFQTHTYRFPSFLLSNNHPSYIYLSEAGVAQAVSYWYELDDPGSISGISAINTASLNLNGRYLRIDLPYETARTE
jgi:hypothetical protein